MADLFFFFIFKNLFIYLRIAQGDQLSALSPPRGVGDGEWEGDARGKRYGDICICIADSLCYKAETNTPL